MVARRMDGSLSSPLGPAASQDDTGTIVLAVPKGRILEELGPLLARAGIRPAADYAAALKDTEALGVPAQAKGKVEGWLFPDTYEFGSQLTAEQQLQRMVAHTHDVLDSLGVSDADAQRVLTVASINEVEASSAEDYAKVARVIANRLANKLGNGGKLQLDSTAGAAPSGGPEADDTRGNE